ncbi:MAG: AfsR/SARP family transcriptional regulator [Acidimicrobiales bacterium]
MDIRVLGLMEVSSGDQLVALGGVRQRAVLAALVARHPEAVTSDQLAEAVWDDNPPAAGSSTLRSYVSVLRRALEPDRPRSEQAQVVRTTSGGYVLDLPAEAIDAYRFEQLMTEGRRALGEGRSEQAARLLAEALDQWRGEAYQDFIYADFAAREARRLEDLRLDCTEDLFEAELALGHHRDIVSAAETHREAHSLRERAVELLMTALYRCGRQADALRVFDDARRRLVEELGVDPSPSLVDRYQAILEHSDDALSTARRPSTRTLTFLFGDVEASTQHVRDLDDRYAAALEQARDIVGRAAAVNEGRDLRNWGDGFIVAFDSANRALEAAIAAQLELAGSGCPLALRMGIHSGDATRADGDYTGLTVHVAARIHEAGHGGQILVSPATRDLVIPDRGDEVEFNDLGQYRLKDVPGGSRLFQVCAPGLDREFPPLRAQRIQSSNLPTPSTVVVGREDEIAAIDAMFDSSRLVTLTGVGGVGKTRLAVEYGRHVTGRYADGVWLCELAGAASESEVVHTVSTTLGVTPADGRRLRDTLLDAVAERRSLVILDNCEHLLDETAALADAALSRGSELRVLATSREPLGAAGEHIRVVPSLGVFAGGGSDRGAAVELFEQRARAVRPQFAVDDSVREAVQEICRRLDGIPLAIELAAARVSSMSPGMIRERLDRDSLVLRSTVRGRADRHRTLHAAIRWSYDLLLPAEQLLFDQLSVFSGGFTLDAAEPVCGPAEGIEGGVVGGIERLVDKSMITVSFADDGARYTVLETLRQFGEDRLDERGMTDATRRVHAGVYRDTLNRGLASVGSSDEQTWFRCHFVEVDNIRDAIAWALESGDTNVAADLGVGASISFFGGAHEAAEWTRAIVAMPGILDHRHAPMLLTSVAHLYWTEGDLDLAGNLTQQAFELTSGPDDERRIWPLGMLCVIRLIEGNLAEVRSLAEEGTALCNRTGREVWGQIWFALNAVLTDAYDGHPERAADRAYEMGRYAEAVGSPMLRARAYYGLGEALAVSDPERALAVAEKGVEIGRGLNSGFGLGIGLVTVASLRSRLGDQAGALHTFLELLDLWRLAGNWTQQWTTIRNLIELLAEIGADVDAAMLIAATEEAESAPALHGVHGQRFTEVCANVRTRLGEEAWKASVDRGRRLEKQAVLDLANDIAMRSLERVAVGEPRPD